MHTSFVVSRRTTLRPAYRLSHILVGWGVVIACLLGTAVGEEPAEDKAAEDAAAGHSYHGEAFNDGPRQAAYLMPGMGIVEFKASTSDEQVQRFINQGVAQLHGFWYYEAERSFRQAAVLDPECAIAYWGMALSNVENKSRARDFIAEAVKRKEGASKHEQMFIDAFAEFFKEDEKGKRRERKDVAQQLTRDLEAILLEFPDSVEARAFLAVQLWQNERSGLPIVSHVAIDALLQDVFDANPDHPAHHYRIHLWDNRKAEQALASAAQCGQCSPGIAHMWHMPGHIYSKLHRYHDACWQQEASARVDHAHMMRDRVMPDQIHNFAHNNEWFIRNLVKIGRVGDALDLAKNMQELPRHPKYNTLDKRGSTRYGRERLLLVLTNYRLWPELIELADSVYLEATDDTVHQNERLRHLAVAHALTGNIAQAAELRTQLEAKLQEATSELNKLEAEQAADKQAEEAKTAAAKQDDKAAQDDAAMEADKSEAEQPQSTATDEAAGSAGATAVEVADAAAAAETVETADKAAQATDTTATPPADDNTADSQQAEDKKTDGKKAAENRKRRQKERDDSIKKLKESKEKLEKQIAAIQACELASDKQWEPALEAWGKSDLDDKLLKAEWMVEANKQDEAFELVTKEIDSKPGEVLPLAVMSWLKYRTASATAASETFEQLRLLASTADLDTPLLDRLKPLAAELGFDEQWSVDYVQAADAGNRPDLDALGPFRWHPYLAPNFAVETANGDKLTLTRLGQQPTIVIFYLGFGCLHCVEQLHAFSPRVEEFRQQGIEVIAISSEDRESLNKAMANYSKPLELPLHADPKLSAFKSFRCFDDFEQQPLHGTFLIDPDGRVLWQDISYEPFMDVDFCLAEAQRLLKLAGYGDYLEPLPTLPGKKVEVTQAK